MTALDRYLGNPCGWVDYWARSDPDRPALTVDDTTLTYLELATWSQRVADGLANAVSPGDRIAYLGQNEPEIMVGLLATWRLGATFLPLNYRLPIAELEPILRDAQTSALIAGSGFAESLDGLRNDLGLRVAHSVGSARDGWQDFAPMPASGPQAEGSDIRPGVPRAADDPVVLLYTSGTTGRPKGVIWSASNVFWSVRLHSIAAGTSGWDVNLISGPAVMAGPLFMILSSWASGGHVLLMSHHFEPAETLGAIEKHSVTLGATSPLILQMLAEDPEFPKTDLSSLRCLVVGGGPVSTELLDVFMARGVRLTQGYGMTETTAVATFLPLSATRSKLGSAGVPLPGIEVDIVDLSGVRQAAGAVGEILVRGPNVMAGYWGGPAGPTSAVDSDGWLHTGDAGYLDTDGHLYVVDRIKDMIISGGLNVYAAEVEQVLQRHPAVREIAVIGLPDTTYGEAVTAVIALQPGFTVTLDELRAAGRSDLAGYKLPRRVELCESLPRNANGKVLKAQLRERLTAGDASGAAR